MATITNHCSCAFCLGLAGRPMLFADHGVGFVDDDAAVFDLTASMRGGDMGALMGTAGLGFIAAGGEVRLGGGLGFGATRFGFDGFAASDTLTGAPLTVRALPGIDPLTGGLASNDDPALPIDDDANDTPWPAPIRLVEGVADAAAATPTGAQPASAASAITPTVTPNAGQDQIIQWITGLKADGSTTSSSFWSTSRTGVSWSWGAGSTVTIAFDPGSNWSVGEQNAWLQGFAIWSGEANVKFQLVSDVNQAQVALARYRPGAVVKGRTLNSGAYEQFLGSQYTDSTFTKVKATSALISLQVSTPASGFGDITSYATYGGYGVSTFMHEIGHLMGLGHAGNYNGSVNSATQQQNAYDVRTWSTMSYIQPTDATAKYYSQYAPGSTSWGGTADGYGRAPYTPMILDVAGVQRLYGDSTNSTFAGGQIFGFNTNIVYTTVTGATDTISQFDFTKDTKPVVTIYDRGLNNTLDLSGYSTTSVVDLRQGGFSSVAGLVNNIGIAFGTHIDIAIGGTGNDTFYVNDDGDIVDGGAGSDTVVFSGAFASYTAFRTASGGATVNANGIAHTLTNIETLKFSDQTVSVGSLSLPNGGTQVAIAATDASKAEGNSGATQFTFTVTRSGNLTGATSVNWTLTGSTADAADFAGGVMPNGFVTFAAGEASKIVTVNVAGDTTVEADETIVVTLFNASGGATIATATATGTILNDDAAPATLSIAALAASKLEGAAGAATPFTFTVTRAGNTAVAAGATWAVTGQSASAADFAGGVLPSGTVAFAAGETSKTITVNVAGDSTIESDEGFTVALSAPTGGATIVAASAAGTILNDDSQVSIAATSAAKAEGNSGSTGFTFTVTRAGYTALAQSVAWSVAGTGVNAANVADFTGGVLPTGIVSFAAGETAKIVTVGVAGDATVESDETFAVTLSAPTAGLTLGVTTAVGTIQNDDVAPATLSIAAASASKLEGAAGATTPFTFTVTRGGNTAVAAAATWAVAGSGANPASASDFVGNALPSGTVAFAAGEISKTVTVNVAGDATIESDEGFTVSLSAASAGATIVAASAAGAILNDDSQVSIAATSAAKAEGNSGSTGFTFTVTRAGYTALAQSVAWSVTGTGVNAANAADFTGGVLPTGIVSFAAGETAKVVSIGVAGDTLVESNETFAVALSAPSAGMTLGVATATGTIQNDDASLATLSIAAAAASKFEGSAGATTPFTFTVTRGGNTAVAAGATWAVAGSGANPASASDFVGNALPSGTVAFAAGETSKTVTVNVAGDSTIETDEGFTVGLSAATVGAALSVATAAGTIQNDDVRIRVFVPVAGASALSFSDLIALAGSGGGLARDLIGGSSIAPLGGLQTIPEIGFAMLSDPNAHPLIGVFG